MSFARLEAWDSQPGNTILSYDGGYLYGYDSSSLVRVKRLIPDSGITMESRGLVTDVDPSYTSIRRIDTTAVSGTILITVQNGNNEFDLLRSTDGGNTFTKVLDYGAGNGPGGADATHVYILAPIALMTVNYPGQTYGAGDLILGEYNINGSRTPGGTNDRVRILRSVDNGATWTQLMEWNTNGSNQIGHVHAIRQDPFTGYVYILTGDDNNKAGIIRWDGVSSWQSNNATLATIGSWPGFNVATGTQRHRSVDILFTESYAFTFTDTSPMSTGYSTEETGIWRWSKNLSSHSRVDNTIVSHEPQMVGWYGLRVGNNLVFSVAIEANASYPTATNHRPYFVSSDGGSSWHIGAYCTGRTDTSTTSWYPLAFTLADGKIYETGNSLIQAGFSATTVMHFDGTMTSSPSTVHPVYYVGTWSALGSDLNLGRSKWEPTATLNRLLTGNRVTGGARIRVSSGMITDNNSIWAQWNNHTAPCNNRGIIIEGQGRNSTNIRKTTDGYYLYLDTTRMYDYPVVFRNLSITNLGSTSNSYCVGLYDGTPDVEMYDSYLYSLSASPFVAMSAGGTLKTYRTILDTGTTGMNVINNSATFVQKHYYSIFINGQYSLTLRYSNSETEAYHCIFYNFNNVGIQVFSGANRIPTAKNCIFYGKTSGTVGIADASGQEEDGTTILNNVFFNCTAVSNISNFSDTNKVNTNPLFINPGIDFRLQPSSPCINAGGIVNLHTDMDGKFVPNGSLPDIGAYEYGDKAVDVLEYYNRTRARY